MPAGGAADTPLRGQPEGAPAPGPVSRGIHCHVVPPTPMLSPRPAPISSVIYLPHLPPHRVTPPSLSRSNRELGWVAEGWEICQDHPTRKIFPPHQSLQAQCNSPGAGPNPFTGAGGGTGGTPTPSVCAENIREPLPCERQSHRVYCGGSSTILGRRGRGTLSAQHPPRKWSRESPPRSGVLCPLSHTRAPRGSCGPGWGTPLQREPQRHRGR